MVKLYLKQSNTNQYTDKPIKTKFLYNSWIKVYFAYNFSLYHNIGTTLFKY